MDTVRHENVKLNNSQIKLIIIAAAIILLTGGLTSTGIKLQSVGYPSAFEGPKVTFFGVNYGGRQYNLTADTSIDFNPDGVNKGKPAVRGEMTTIFLPETSVNNIPNGGFWPPIPTSWIQNTGLFQTGFTGQNYGQNKPEAVYNWTLGNNQYYMSQWRMKWYVTFSAEWTGEKEDPANGLYGGEGVTFWNPHAENVYQNAQIWLEFDLKPTWYIEGGGTGYFAIARMQLDENALMQGRDANGKFYPARTTESVDPESQQSAVMLFYNPYGVEAPATQDASYYQGKALNPSYFRNNVYAHIDLKNFGAYSDASNILALGHSTKGDSVTFAFDITVFSIGEWQVKDVQKIPVDQNGNINYGRFMPIQTIDPIGGLFSGIGNWFNNPLNWIWIALAVIIILAIFAPGVLVALFGRRKK